MKKEFKKFGYIIQLPLPLQPASKETVVLQKVDNQIVLTYFLKEILKITKEKFGKLKKALTFATRFKKAVVLQKD